MQRTLHKIWENDKTVTLSAFEGEAKQDRERAVIILPGGGYLAPAPREADPVAERFAELGYTAYVLRYSTAYESFENMSGAENPHTVFPEPLCETAAAIAFARARGAERVALVGFSAGGHLAANYANHWKSAQVLEGAVLSPALAKPDACVLCYAATSLFREGGERMRALVLGDDSSEERVKKYSAQHGINADTPPTFLWHSEADEVVPVSQTLDMAEALQKNNIPFEKLIYKTGGHATGLSLGLEAEPWLQSAAAFLEKYM